jgi:hypothetical protein
MTNNTRRMLLSARENEPIVADGRERLQGEERYRRRKREVGEAVRRRHGPESAAARGFERSAVYWRMWRQLRRETEALASGRALYLRR